MRGGRAVSRTDAVKLAREGLVALVGKVGGRGLNALVNVVLGRLLGPEHFGMYAIGWSLMRMVGLFSPLGLDKGVIYYGTQYRDTDKERFKGALLGTLGLALASGVILGLGIFSLAPWLANVAFRKPQTVSVIRMFALVFGFYPVLRVASAATTISKQVRFAVFAQEFIQPFTSLALVLVFYWAGWGVAGAVGAVVLSFGVAAVLAVYYVKELFPSVFSLRPRPLFQPKSLLGFSVPSAFAGIFAMYMVWTTQLLVGRFRSLVEAGIYQAASQIALLLPIIQASFTMAISPLIAELWKRGERIRLEELYRVATKWTLYLGTPVILVMMLRPQGVMTILFGARYAEGASALRMLVLAQTANIATGSVGPLLVMTGHQRRWSLVSGIAFIVNLMGGLLFIPRMGIFGAALGMTISFVGMCIWGLVEIRRLVGIWPYDLRYLKGTVAAGSAMAATLAGFAWLKLPPKSEVLAIAVIVVVVFGGMLLLLGLDGEDRDLFRALKARFG